MIAWILATVLSFCPITRDPWINGYHCWAYALERDFGSQPCEPGLCDSGGNASHQFRVLGCSVNTADGTLFLGSEAPNEYVVFSVEPEWVCVPGNCTLCAPGECDYVWWIPSLDPNAQCTCPDGEC